MDSANDNKTRDEPVPQIGVISPTPTVAIAEEKEEEVIVLLPEEDEPLPNNPVCVLFGEDEGHSAPEKPLSPIVLSEEAEETPREGSNQLDVSREREAQESRVEPADSTSAQISVEDLSDAAETSEPAAATGGQLSDVTSSTNQDPKESMPATPPKPVSTPGGTSGKSPEVNTQLVMSRYRKIAPAPQVVEQPRIMPAPAILRPSHSKPAGQSLPPPYVVQGQEALAASAGSQSSQEISLMANEALLPSDSAFLSKFKESSTNALRMVKETMFVDADPLLDGPFSDPTEDGATRGPAEPPSRSVLDTRVQELQQKRLKKPPLTAPVTKR